MRLTTIIAYIMALITAITVNSRKIPTTQTKYAESIKCSVMDIVEENKSTKSNNKVVKSNTKNLGKFRITVYTPYSDGGKWGYATATGAKSKHLSTCAVDKNVIPLGSTIYVNGLKLKAVDTGSAVKGKHIDIFYDGTEKQAIKWAEQFGEYAEVRVCG